jgi:hypothetical protein
MSVGPAMYASLMPPVGLAMQASLVPSAGPAT